MARHAPAEVGARVVDLTPPPGAAAPLGRRAASAQRRRRVEAGVGHAEGSEDLLGREAVEGPPVHPLDQLTENDEADVRVGEGAAWLLTRRQGADAAPGLVGAVLVVRERVVRDEPAAVEQEVLDGDALLAVPPELGQVGGHRRAEVDAALVHEDHDAGGGGHDLREGGEVEHGPGLHVRRPVEAARPPEDPRVRRLPSDPLVQQHCAGHEALIDPGQDRAVHLVERSTRSGGGLLGSGGGREQHRGQHGPIVDRGPRGRHHLTDGGWSAIGAEAVLRLR